MIATRFGSEVVVHGVDRTGEWVRVRRVADGADREWRVADLRADTQEELQEALEQAPVYD